MALGCLALGTLLGALQAPTGAITGTVRDAQSLAPLSGASVTVAATHRVAVTDSAGRYLLSPVPAGASVVVVRRLGYTPAQFRAIVAPHDTIEISVALDPQPVILQPIETHAALPGLVSRVPEAAGSESRALSSAEIRDNPLVAEPDAIAALSGGMVVVRAESPTGLHVRGGTGDQVTHAIDGIPILNPFHLSGVFSALNPDALDSLELRGLPLPSEASEGLSGAVLATSRAPGDRLRVQSGFSMTQLRAAVDGPLPGGVGYLLSVRSAFPGLLSHRRDPTYLRGESQDWMARLQLPVFGGTGYLLGFDVANDVSASSRASTQLVPGQPPPRNRFEWFSRSLGAGWNGGLGQAEVAVRAWHASGTSEATWRAVDSLPERLQSRERATGVSVQVDGAGPAYRTTGGVRAEWHETTYDLRPLATGGRRLDLDGNALLLQGYLRYLRQVGPRTSAEVTAVTTVARPGSRFSPALALRHDLGPHLTVSLSGSRRHQYLQSLRNPESVVAHVFPAELPALAGTAGVRIARSDEAGLDLDARPTGALRLELRGYLRRSAGLTLVAPRQADPFATVGLTTGRGRAAGASLALRWSGDWHEFVAIYGIQRVRFTYGDSSYTPAWGGSQLFDAGLVVRPLRGTAIRLSLSAEQGARTTTIEDPFEWEACNLLDDGCEFAGTPHRRAEPLGSARLPTYARTDLGLRQTVFLRMAGRNHQITAYGTLTNLFSRRNLLTFVRDPGSGRPLAVTTRPRSPLVVGLEWSF